MLFFYFLLSFAKRINNKDKQGAYVIKYKVQVNIIAQTAINLYMSTTYKKPYALKEANEIFFNNIFDAINITLEPYHVQVQGDYSNLTFVETSIQIPPDKICQSNNAVGMIANGMKINMMFPINGGAGNTIIIYKCLVDLPYMNEKYASRIQQCGNLSVIYLNDPLDLIKVVSDTVEAALTYGTNQYHAPNSKPYRDKVEQYLESCVVDNDTIGYFKEGLVNLRNNNRARISEIEGQRKMMYYY